MKSNAFPKTVYDNVAYGPKINGIKNKLSSSIFFILNELGRRNQSENAPQM